MRRFIVEVVLDAILLAFIVLLLGAISVAQPFPFGGNGDVPIIALRGAGPIGFLSWAAVLVLVNRFARPVLVALTGRLLFSTLGLFIVIINAIAIWLTSLIAPIKIGIVADPAFLWIIVGGGPVHGAVDPHGRAPRPESADLRHGRQRRDLALPRVAADAATQRDHREPAAPAGLQRDLHDQPGHRAGGHAGRGLPALVRPGGHRQQGHPRPA